MMLGGARKLAGVVLAGAALLAAGCGGSDGGGGGGATAATNADGATALKVGIQPVAEAAPLYVGIEQGFFRDEGLEIEPVINAGGGAPITAQVVSGEVQIGFSNPTSIVLARDNGVDLKIVAPASAAGQGDDDASVWIVSRRGSGIDEARDLEGKTLAVNTLANVLEITVKESLSRAGVDAESVRLVEVPFPDMPAALDTGRVDAFVSVEPFVSQALANGGQRIWNPYERTQPGLSTADYFATARFVEENADVAERFRRAIRRATEYTNATEGAVQEILPTYTQLSPEVIQAIRLPTLVETLDEAAYGPHVELSRKYGLTRGEESVQDLLAP